jgi:hypothetical protein
MKSIYVLGITAFIFLANCSPKATESNEGWKEMDDFHLIMAEAFHPFKDSANLQPAKQTAEQLLLAARKWKESALPDKVDTESVKGKLAMLEKEAMEFSQIVKQSNDSTVSKSLIKLHDLFHELQEEWYGAKEHNHDHH